MQDWVISSTLVKPTFWQDFKSVIKGGEAYLPGYSQKSSKYLQEKKNLGDLKKQKFPPEIS
jgi:hypothetical protein